MNVAGLDFGTTNSILSYVGNNSIESYRMGGVEGSSYVPSYLVIDEKDPVIGMVAKEKAASGKANLEVYTNFKILLGEKNQKKLENNGYSKQKSPRWAVEQYLSIFLKKYQEEMRIDKIDNLVVTIPEIWQNDNLLARRLLKQSLEKIGYENTEFVSEPSAAGAFFLERYEEQKGTKFRGHFIVFDYGGGTLDLSLIKAQDNRMKLLERAGVGYDVEHIGKAGVAYDREVVKRALSIANVKIADNEPVFYPILIEFEKKKITFKNEIKKAIEKYEKIGKDQPIFDVRYEGTSLVFPPSLLLSVYEDLLEATIIDVLQKIKKHFVKYDIDDTDDKHFKIVMVGGFSSYWLTQRTVRNFFGSVTDSDKRFEDVLRLEETALAISKGAALVANSKISVDLVYPMTIGVMAAERNGDGTLRLVKTPILIRGEEMKSNYIKYIPQTFGLWGSGIQLYIDDGTNIQTLSIGEDNSRLFPNAKVEDNVWRLGIKVDSNGFSYIYIVDKYDTAKTHELGHLFETINKG